MKLFNNFKRKLITLLLLFLSMIFIPLLSVFGKNKEIPDIKPSSKEITKSKNLNCENNFFTVLDESDNKIIKISDREFLYGVVASEMPALFEEEALKAQAVASYTYFCRERNKFRKSNPSNTDYEFTVNTSKWINYIPKEQMQLKWGENFEKYYNKIKKCVDSVFPEVIEEENGELILAAYHAISSGKTEQCKDVFGGDLKYLTNVESPGDKLVPNYETLVEISVDEFKKALLNEIKESEIKENPKEWLGDYTRSDGGMIKEINIFSKTFKGSDIRKIFGLRSSDFDLNYNSETDKFIFTVRGYGHGVGMSQHGAQYMAKQSANYKEILSWYYPNTYITNLKSI